MRPGIALLLSTAMLALLVAFLAASRGAGASAPGDTPGYWDEVVEAFVRRKVAETYVDELGPQGEREAFNRAMDAYLDLDNYCDYIPPEEYKRWLEDTAGRYAGLGVKINGEEDGLHVVGVFPGGPADRAGIQVGDTIVRADGEALAGLDVDAVTSRLKGPPRTTVRIGYVRGPRPVQGPHAGPELETVVTRDMIRPPTLFTRRVGTDGGFLQLRLTDFAEESAEEFDEAMDALDNGPPVKGLLLDLRHNGGGVLGVAVRVVDRFLRKGRLVVRMEGRGADASKNYSTTDRAGKNLDMPMVVLVDRKSASASEVVAGALQDHRRAILVGSRSYGKFLVQSITEIPHRGAAVKLTTARYYTPSGRSYQGPSQYEVDHVERPRGAGLIPDVVIDLTEEEEEELLKFWQDEEGRAWNAIRLHPQVPEDYVDPQLERAIKLLEGEIVLQKIGRGGRAKRRNG